MRRQSDLLGQIAADGKEQKKTHLATFGSDRQRQSSRSVELGHAGRLEAEEGYRLTITESIAATRHKTVHPDS